jgi:hypothetical protein
LPNKIGISCGDNAMRKKQDAVTTKKALELDTWDCPVCGKPRNKGKHVQCSKITQLKHIKERGEI